MKKFIAAGAMALGLALATQQPAHAWVNFKLGVGFNLEFSCGNNSLLWGLYQSGQVPTPPGWSPNLLPPHGGYGVGNPYCDGYGGAAIPMFEGPPAGFYTGPIGPAGHHAAAPASPFQNASYPGYGYGYAGYGYGY